MPVSIAIWNAFSMRSWYSIVSASSIDGTKWNGNSSRPARRTVPVIERRGRSRIEINVALRNIHVATVARAADKI